MRRFAPPTKNELVNSAINSAIAHTGIALDYMKAERDGTRGGLNAEAARRVLADLELARQEWEKYLKLNRT